MLFLLSFALLSFIFMDFLHPKSCFLVCALNQKCITPKTAYMGPTSIYTKYEETLICSSAILPYNLMEFHVFSHQISYCINFFILSTFDGLSKLALINRRRLTILVL